MAYATKTEVPIEKTKSEIDRLLDRAGADQTMMAESKSDGVATVQFRAQNRHVRFNLKLPPADQFLRTPARGQRRSAASAQEAHQQALRSRWRALLLCIRAKLEAVESGISTFEDEFLAYVVVPSGQTVGQMMAPQLERAYADGSMPAGIAGLLPGPDA